jgi:hypothetical protein
MAGAAGHTPEHRKAWVISATSADEKAYEGRFSLAVAAVLRRLLNDPLQLEIDETVEFVPLATLVRAVEQELARRCRADGAVPQRVATTPVGIGKQPAIGFIRNPAYKTEAARRLNAGVSAEDALRSFVVELDPVLDAGHYLSRAFGRPDHADPKAVCLLQEGTAN